MTNFKLPRNFKSWLDTFLSEKEIDGDELLEAETNAGAQVPVRVVVELIKAADASEQHPIYNTLIELDFRNADVRHYLNHLAHGALASGAIPQEVFAFV